MKGAFSTDCTVPLEQSVLIWLVAAPAMSSSSASHCRRDRWRRSASRSSSPVVTILRLPAAGGRCGCKVGMGWHVCGKLRIALRRSVLAQEPAWRCSTNGHVKPAAAGTPAKQGTLVQMLTQDLVGSGVHKLEEEELHGEATAAAVGPVGAAGGHGKVRPKALQPADPC